MVRPNGFRGIWSGPVLVNSSGARPLAPAAAGPRRATPAPITPARLQEARRAADRRPVLFARTRSSLIFSLMRAGRTPIHGPPASLNSISWTSFCLMSSGKPCGRRACGLSNASDSL